MSRQRCNRCASWSIRASRRRRTHASSTRPAPRLIYAAVPDEARSAALRARGAQIAIVPGPNRKVDLAAMLGDLAERGVNELHVEAGHKLNGSFVREGLVDEFLIYLAPKMLGQGRGLADFGPLERLDDALELRFHGIDRVGDDLRIVARLPGRERF